MAFRSLEIGHFRGRLRLRGSAGVQFSAGSYFDCGLDGAKSEFDGTVVAVSSLIRYPKEIFNAVSWGVPIGFLFTFLLPVMLVVNVPAHIMLRAIEPWFVLYLIVATVAMLAGSRWFFRLALRKYRSASS